MTVYVDDAIWPFRGGKWCHMTATTHKELHLFARRLGLKRAWFQDKDHHQHYDLNARKRALALEHGAVAVDWRDYPIVYAELPISMGWKQLGLDYDADVALGLPDAEVKARAHARYWEWKADRALAPFPRPRKQRSPPTDPLA